MPKCHTQRIVLAAGKKSICDVRMSGNIVLTTVTLLSVIRMAAAMADMMKLQSYQSAMAQAQIMLQQGIIDQKDIVLVESKLAEKYGLKSGSIYREIDLINVAFRANMV